MNLTILKNRLASYLEAERAILNSQEYTIGTRRLVRADLKAVQAEIERLSEEIDALEESSRGQRRAVVF